MPCDIAFLIVPKYVTVNQGFKCPKQVLLSIPLMTSAGIIKSSLEDANALKILPLAGQCLEIISIFPLKLLQILSFWLSHVHF